MNFVPKWLQPFRPNTFDLYGFSYSCIAQYILVQDAAENNSDFMQFFHLKPKELPPIENSRVEVIEEALQIIITKYFPHENLVYTGPGPLGVGVSRMACEFGAKPKGENLYGKAIENVLTRLYAKK